MKRLILISFLIAVVGFVGISSAYAAAGSFDALLGTTQIPGDVRDEERLWALLDAARDDIVLLEGGALGDDGNWTNDGTDVTLDANSSVSIKNATGIFSAVGVDLSSMLTLGNDQMIQGTTNNAFLFVENSDTLTLGFDGDDLNITFSDGSIQLIPESSQSDGTIDFMAGGDTDDYVEIILTGANTPSINFNGCDGIITASGGDIDFSNENLVTTGTLGSGAFTGGSTGSFASTTTLSDDVTFENAEVLDNSTDDTVKFSSNDTAMVLKVISGGDATDAQVTISADKDDDAADDWHLKSVAADNDFHILNSSTLRLTIDVNGNILTTGDLTVAGTVPEVWVGDGGAEDTQIIFNGNAADWHVAIDDSADVLEIGVGRVPGTDGRLLIDDAAASTLLTIGDGVNAEDKIVVFDGNAVDFNITMDDSADDLVIGVGQLAATTPGLIIDGADASVSIGLATGAIIATGANDLFVADACEIAGDLSTAVNMTISNPVSITGTCYYAIIHADGTVGKSAVTWPRS